MLFSLVCLVPQSFEFVAYLSLQASMFYTYLISNANKVYPRYISIIADVFPIEMAEECMIAANRQKKSGAGNIIYKVINHICFLK